MNTKGLWGKKQMIMLFRQKKKKMNILVLIQ